MSEPSDFEIIIPGAISPSNSLNNVSKNLATNHLTTEKTSTINFKINVNDTSAFVPLQSSNDVSLTDSDHSMLETPKIMNASSPSSVCSTRPLEWDSGADVGYDITSKQQSQDMSTIERIAVSSLVYNANSTPINYKNKNSVKIKSNSLDNLKEIELSKCKKSASYEAPKLLSFKSDTLPKCNSPMNSSLSLTTVVHKLETLNPEQIKQFNDRHINIIFQQQEKKFEKLNINFNKERKSSESSKESNSTLNSVDTAESWVAKEIHDSTNTNTDRVNSFEYLPGNSFYNTRNDELEDFSDTEIKQNTKILVEAMKQNGLTNEFQRKEIFQKIVDSFLRKYLNKKCNLSIKSESDSNTPAKQDFTSQTSNTANTIVNNETNNQSSTITFTSPITSSRYGDDVDSKYDESSMDSEQHIDIERCKLKNILIPTNKYVHQGTQCTIQDTLVDGITNKYLKQSTHTSTRSNKFEKNGQNLKSYPKYNLESKTNTHHRQMEFNKQMIWFHSNYLKTERENQMLWINSQISHLNNLKKLFNTHEELKKNWNSYKQKPIINNKSKLRRSPVSNSSSDFTTISKTNSSINSKQFSSTDSPHNDTDVESSTTVCDHIHYKKGILTDEPKSIKKCCEKTLIAIEEKQKQNTHKLKTTCSQTESINAIKLYSDGKYSSQSCATYTINQELKSSSSKSSISYDIIFKPTSKRTKEINFVDNKSEKQKQSTSVACQTNKVLFKPKSSLQEYLMVNRPDYVCRAKERQNILADLVNLRDQRKQLKRDLLISNDHNNEIPPNPLAVKRVMSQKEMRKLTERKYRKCPEVKSKKNEIKRKQEYHTNKMMANIFNKKLQKKTLKGKVDLSNSVSVCSL